MSSEIIQKQLFIQYNRFIDKNIKKNFERLISFILNYITTCYIVRTNVNKIVVPIRVILLFRKIQKKKKSFLFS